MEGGAWAGPRQSRVSSLLSDSPRSWPDASLPRWSRPGARFQQRHVRTFGAYRDFAGALGAWVQCHSSHSSMIAAIVGRPLHLEGDTQLGVTFHLEWT